MDAKIPDACSKESFSQRRGGIPECPYRRSRRPTIISQASYRKPIDNLKLKKSLQLNLKENNIASLSRPTSPRFHDNSFVYKIKKIEGELPIDCDWAKKEWAAADTLKIGRTNGWAMTFKPEAAVKLCYNDRYVYLIYRVNDSFVRCLTSEVNGPVHKDACVEFFFSPVGSDPRGYFNLEINCGGTIKLGYRNGSWSDAVHARSDDVNGIIVCHSLPGIIEREIEGPVVWTLELAVPFEALNKYSPVAAPGTGTKWRANFYKCAENNSHPHWLSWAPIDSPVPNFHLPEFFGEVEFG